MTAQEIRESFLQFFKQRGHTVVHSSPVVPFDDPTLLFTNAGMNQFKDVFLGIGQRPYSRAVDTQKCIRVSGKHNDLEEVGRDTYHHTFFEMLGNWSFGDYYKKEAIRWAWELLTSVWGLPKERLWATVYTDDDEAEQLWKTETDIDPTHILRFGANDNFWEMGETGPCGPCSEIHMDRTPNGTATAAMVNTGVPDVMEIWNLVFIQFDRDAEGTLHPLPAKHVDTGMGFERICAVLQKKQSNYDTDIFSHLIKEIAQKTGKSYDGRMDGSTPPLQAECDTAMRVIADHIRALSFAIGDGAVPSNEGRGYVVRRLLRRAARFGRTLGFREPFLYTFVPSLVSSMGEAFPELKAQHDHIQKIVKSEEESFNATLDRGLEVFGEVVQKSLRNNEKLIRGEDVFKLYDTYGFPVDLTALLAEERGLLIDSAGFEEQMTKQRQRSRSKVQNLVKHLIPNTQFINAKIKIQQGDYHGAIPLLESEVEKNPENEEAWYFLGVLKGDAGEYSAMNEAFNKALKLSNIHAEAIHDIRHNKWGQHLNSGVEFLERVNADSPEYFEKAIHEFEVSLEASPDRALSYRYLGYAYVNKGDLDAAAAAFQKAWDVGNDSESAKRLGRIYLTRGNELKSKFENSNAEKFKSAALEQYNNAIAVLEKVKKTDPTDNEILSIMLSAYVESNRVPEAAKEFRLALKNDPGNASNHYIMGVLLRTMGEFDDAVIEFKEAFRLDSTNDDALFDIGATYYNWGVDMIRAADDKAEESSAFKAKFQAAVPFMEKVATRRESDPQVWETLGTIYERLDMKDKALGAFDKAAELRERKPKMRIDDRSFPKITEVKIPIKDDIKIVSFAPPSRDTLAKFTREINEQKSEFVGYDDLSNVSTVLKGDRHLLVLLETPFFAESGGQVGDQGFIEFQNDRLHVHDTQRIGNLDVHILDEAARVLSGDTVTAIVDRSRRLAIMRNHTATHLVHAALRNILGTHVHQAGSLVAPDHLRFDFAHFAKVSDAELTDIEILVNEKVREDIKLLHHRDIPFAEAKKMGALMFFGEKYGEKVNVVEFGEFSKEFCGGTHVASTAEIEYFKFRSEGSVASGIRRIEAVCSEFALELLKLADYTLVDLIDRAERELDALSTLTNELRTSSNGTSPLLNESFDSLVSQLTELKTNRSIPDRVISQLGVTFDEQMRKLRAAEDLLLRIAEQKKGIEKETARFRLKSLTGNIEELLRSATTLNGLKLVSAQVPASSMDELKALGDRLRDRLGSGVGMLASIVGEKVALVCVVTDDLVAAKRLDAAKVVGAVAKILGGGGGGKAHLATAGGKDISKVGEALESTASVVHSFLT